MFNFEETLRSFSLTTSNAFSFEASFDFTAIKEVSKALDGLKLGILDL